ncbi:MAG: FKBP-type peptidyl-prolyl cis-trans isomerase [Bacteroidales bacterium]|nr:FKBP-type peptidyl-prolyl cis-trans isomerase [Bacteroidales bacterium]
MSVTDKKSYALGIVIGADWAKMGIKIDIESFTKGFADTMNGTTPELTMSEIQNQMQLLQQEIQVIEKKDIEEEKQRGRQFLEENKKKPGVIETPSGLQYKVLRESIGKKPTATSTVEVHYHGTLIDGTVFDSSVNRGETIEFPLNQVIKGWTEGLQLMSEGSKFEFYIPSHLAYGDNGAGGAIKGGATLIFQVELFKVK